MSQATTIEWTDVSWNPIHGCSIVSTECRNCYAQTLSLRYRQTLKPWTPANAPENVILKPHKLREPLSNAKAWRGLGAAAALAGKTDGMLVFVNSMSDLFHEQVPDEYIARVFAVMAEAERHTFQVLTKRPDRMRDWARIYQPEPLPNVWLGTSIGLRQFVGRADQLRDTPAAVRFISAEPLLGPLVRSSQPCPKARMGDDRPCIRTMDHPGDCAVSWGSTTADFGEWPPELDLHGIDWLIVGGESGAGHRPIGPEWARDLRDAATALGIAYFFKQWGGRTPKAGGRELDGRTWDDMPRAAVVA
jgi:protein gp37